MKERGMIFNVEMVRALLDGRKTQTRRIIKDCTVGRDPISKFIKIGKKFIGCYPEDVPELIRECCPYGVPGDRIWVRETWGVVSHELDEDGRIQPWTPDRPATAIHEMPFGNGYYSGHAIYAADGDFTWGDDDGYEDGRSCWKPSIHMPRAASRILLEITDVRVERLNAISEEDATAEGVPPAGSLLPDYPGTFLTPKGDFATAKVAFQRLWESIYGEESWNANPWVWVISFERIEGGAA